MIQHHDFTCLREFDIAEVEARLCLYEHRKTGAQVLSVRSADDNKVFGITFRTPAEDSSGLPHIMEHAVLAGSERYPVKEPFVELVKSSLNTFLNAMTFPDRTCYPVASQNLKDLRNLVEVYMDAVLHPLIPPRLLDQEGWHYEVDRAGATDAAGAALRLKGVVFNEMKGVYSNPDALLGRYSRSLLLPDTPYAHDSGGDPERIPDLDYQRFRDFHRRFYHPSNALVYFSGDDPEEDRLALVSRWFAGYDRGDRAPPVPLQPRWDRPRRERERYAAGDGPATAKSMLSVNWLLRDHADPERALGLAILSTILLGTAASPLRKALIDSGLGEGLTASGLDDDIREATFSVGLKGIAAEDTGRVEELIRSSLSTLARDGIDPDTVAAGMNSVEFALRENNTGSYPRGLVLLFRCLPSWLYLDDPFASLAFEAPLRSIRQRLARGERYFEELVRADLVENAHALVLHLEPDTELGPRREREERERLAAVRSSLTDEALESIEARAGDLERFQKTPDLPEALARVPSLGLEDLDREVRVTPREILTDGQATFVVHELPTSGVVYVDLGFDLRGLPVESLRYLPLYARCLTEVGTARSDFVRLQQRIGRDTGGIGATLFVSAVRGQEHAATRLFVRGKCLPDRLERLLELMSEMLTELRLDNRERLLQMARESKIRIESSVVPSGHGVVASRLQSKYDEAGWMREQIGGTDYLFSVREIAARVQADWPSVLAALEAVHAAVVTRRGAVCNLTVSPADRAAVLLRLRGFVAALPDREIPRATWRPDWRRYDEGLTAPSQVNFAGKGGSLYQCGYELRGSIFAVLKYVRTTWIWERVRVQGGAYGGMVQFDPVSGFFGYLSYRDPNIVPTLRIYDGTAGFLDEVAIDADELRKSIIGAVGDMEPCLLPDAQGFASLRRYLTGVTDEERQRLRNELLKTGIADFRALGTALHRLADTGLIVALGSPERIREASAALGDRLRVSAVL